jgi:hypothetical protein
MTKGGRVRWRGGERGEGRGRKGLRIRVMVRE